MRVRLRSPLGSLRRDRGASIPRDVVARRRCSASLLSVFLNLAWYIRQQGLGLLRLDRGASILRDVVLERGASIIRDVVARHRCSASFLCTFLNLALYIRRQGLGSQQSRFLGRSRSVETAAKAEPRCCYSTHPRLKLAGRARHRRRADILSAESCYPSMQPEVDPPSTIRHQSH